MFFRSLCFTSKTFFFNRALTMKAVMRLHRFFTCYMSSASHFLVPRLHCFSRPGRSFASRNAQFKSYLHSYVLLTGLNHVRVLITVRLLHASDFFSTVRAMHCLCSVSLRSLRAYSIKSAIRLLTVQLRSFDSSSNRRPRRLKL